MKRRNHLPSLILACIVLAATVGGIWVASAPTGSVKAPPEVRVVGMGKRDLSYSDPESFLEHCVLAVRGTFLGDTDGTPILMDGVPAKYGLLDVETIYKGSCDETLTFLYPGGEVLLSDVIKACEEDGRSLREMNINSVLSDSIKSTDPEANVLLRCADTEDRLKLEEGQEYLVFLGKFRDYDYSVLSDRWGMRPINEQGLVYNPETQNYDTVDFLENGLTQ